MRLDAAQSQRQYDAVYSWRRGFFKTSLHTLYHQQIYIDNIGTRLSASSVRLRAGGDLSTTAARIDATGAVDIRAGGAASYFAAENVSRYSEKHTKDYGLIGNLVGVLFSIDRSSTTTLTIQTSVTTTLQTTEQITSQSGGNTLLQGTRVSAGRGAVIRAGVGEEARADARIILEGVTTTVRQSTSTESSSLVWQRLTDRGSVTETAMALPSFVGGVEFSAPGGLSVHVPQSADLKTQIAALSAQPGMGYLGDLAARSDVNWQQVKLAHESWDHTREGRPGSTVRTRKALIRRKSLAMDWHCKAAARWDEANSWALGAGTPVAANPRARRRWQRRPAAATLPPLRLGPHAGRQ